MTHFAFDSSVWIGLLVIVPIVLLVSRFGVRRRERALHTLAGKDTRAHLTSELNHRRRHTKTALTAVACTFLVIALCRPAWDRVTPAPSKGRDILVLLDVSKSMYADDLAPNRLEVAKRALIGFASRLRGDRIGLIAFAGSAALRCPLTTDYDFFRSAVEGASPDSVTLGGTEIAKAIQFSLKSGFDNISDRSKHLLLITDAEDHGIAAVTAASEASRKSVRLDAVGLGDSTRGSRIPIPSPGPVRYITYQGQEVWSRLNETAIRNLADAGSGNALILGASNSGDPGSALDRLVSGPRGETALPRVQAFWIPLALAAACLCWELSLSEARTP